MSPAVFRACALIAALLLAPAARAADSLPADKVKALKAASVLVKVQAGQVRSSGSGFVFKVEGDAVYVATNQHVVDDALPLDDRLAVPTRPTPKAAPRPAFPVAPGSARVDVVFDSGATEERTLAAEVLAADEEYDLAVLRVRGLTHPPKPIDLTPPQDLVETTPVWVFGFPFGQALATGGRNPAISVSGGKVSSIRLDEAGKPEKVQLDGALNPGNSGGPVLAADGRLVGVAVATIKGSGIGFAVPYQHVDEVLKGRLGGARVRTAGVGGGSAMRITVDVADPFKKMKPGSFRVLALRTAEQATNPVKPTNGKWPALPNAARLTLTPAAHGLTAAAVTPYTGTITAVWTQTEFERPDGTVVRGTPTKHSRPTRTVVALPDSPPGGPSLPDPGASAGLPRPSAPPAPNPFPPPPTAPADPTVFPGQAWDLPANPGGVPMPDLLRFPERFATGAPVAVYGYLHPVTQSRGTRTEALVQTEGRTRLPDLEFSLSRDMAIQIAAEPRSSRTPRHWPVRLTVARVPAAEAPGRPPNTLVYEVREVGFLNDAGQVGKSLRDRDAPAAPNPVAAVTPGPAPPRVEPSAPPKSGAADPRPAAAADPAEEKTGGSVGVVVAVLAALFGLAILGGAVILFLVNAREGESDRRDQWAADQPRRRPHPDRRRDDYDRRDDDYRRRDGYSDRRRDDYDRRDDDYRRPRRYDRD